MLEYGASTVKRRRLVLVEGNDDLGCWESLLEYLGRDGIQVLPYQGTSNLAGYLRALKNQDAFENVVWLAICQDADQDPASAMQRVQGALRRADLPVPRQSWITESGIPSVAAVILPDGREAGDLETLIWGSISERPVGECVDRFLNCLSETGQELPRLTSKARTYSYLAVQQTPGKRLGEAMRAGLFDFGHPVFRPLIDVLPSE